MSTAPWTLAAPETWRRGRLDWMVESCRNGAWGDDPAEDGSDVAVARVADFDWEHLRTVDTIPTLRSLTAHQSRRNALGSRDLLLEKSGGGDRQPVGRAVRYAGQFPAVCSNFLAKVRPHRDTDPRYLNYSLYACYGAGVNERSIKQTTGIQNLDSKAFLSERWAIPPSVHQRAIADYLDRETGRIDALMEKKRRLIELLEEKRTALISHAVTKGLDPTVPMKDSGIPWLGAVPEHWETRRLKRIASLKSGVNITSDDIASDGDYPVYGGNGLRGYTSTKTHVGDFALIGRQGALCGNVNYATGEFFASEHAIVVRPLMDLPQRWLGETLRTMNLGQYSKAAAQPGLAVEVVADLHVPLPPRSERYALATYLTKAESKIHDTADAIARQLTLLAEYRQALITAAVTGQIPGEEVV